MKAKKSFGQHFLKNEAIAERIARGFSQPYERVLEVGPGRGVLTKYLLEQVENLIVVEADRDMVLYLGKHYPELKEGIVHADFLKLRLDLIFQEQSFGLIGNFPYNISSQIVFKMLEYRTYVPELVGMFQKEMAERIISSPGSKTYGVISVLTQAYYEGEYLFSVDREQFIPPPKVESAVIRLKRKDAELDCDPRLFRTIVKRAFSQRRKMLRNTLKGLLNEQILKEDSFFQQRPEKLSVADFVALTHKAKGEGTRD